MYQKKDQHKVTARVLNETEMEINHMPDWEFKVTAVKIFTGPERRVEDLSETLNEKTENIKKKNQRWRTQ